MAENDSDRCSSIREVGGDKASQYNQADHHEWRFLRQYGVFGGSSVPKEVGNFYYCIFCLKTEKRESKDGA